METGLILLGLYLLTRKPEMQRAVRVIPASEQWLRAQVRGNVITPLGIGIASKLGPRVETRGSSSARTSAPGSVNTAPPSTWDIESTVRTGVEIWKSVNQIKEELAENGGFREDDITYTKD